MRQAGAVDTPSWWKPRGFGKYGKLKTWRNQRGGLLSSTAYPALFQHDTLDDLDIPHGTIRSACGSASDARRPIPGGINIFGRGFGNYDQDIVMRLRLIALRRAAAASAIK